ncbi:hypothetical protein [Halovivax sp.]|uniref:hypothetical protein n=1 Tax=Halovivax sp. TaxID=1935978 RepID=UPI0025C3681D|nr:hypothetical protein [Halovivax sp.]
MESERPPRTNLDDTNGRTDAKILTIEGQGTPAGFEITVDGRIEMDAANPLEEATIVSGAAVQGAVDADVQRFLVYGDVTDVTFFDRGDVDGSTVDPEVYLE